jgi:cytochrome c oxidase assembly factor CtaG
VRVPITPPRLSRVFTAAAILAAATALLPPVGTQARHYQWVEGLQFVLLAGAVPALSGLAWRRAHPDAEWPGGPAGAAVAVIVQVAALVAWRVPAGVDALAHHAWLAPLEGVSLLAAGAGLWALLLAPPPWRPEHPSYPWRMACAAVAMWSMWFMAYLVGLSHTTWYPAYPRTTGLSGHADQQLATGVLWAGAACTFLPVIFWSLWAWLRTDDHRSVPMTGTTAAD